MSRVNHQPTTKARAPAREHRLLLLSFSSIKTRERSQHKPPLSVR